MIDVSKINYGRTDSWDFIINKKIKNQNYNCRNCFLKITKIEKPLSEIAAQETKPLSQIAAQE